MDLSEAVRRFVVPGMSIQTGNGMAFPTAAYFEIARRFWGKDPGFTLIGNTGGAYNFAVFAHGRLVRRIISGFNGDGYPFPSPNPILTRAFQEGKVVPESWTYLTLTLRLMAGAMGIPFFPTKSLAGSSMELENREDFGRFENPFSPGEKVGLLKALNPDIALAHGWAADPEGNTILAAPYSGNCYGALAARKGVIVTVEQSKSRFVEKVPYITSPGDKVTTVVSQLGILEKEFGREELRLTAYSPISPNQTEEKTVLAAREQCGWDLQVSPRLQALPLPSAEDLKFIRCFDPKRLFLGGPEAKKE